MFETNLRSEVWSAHIGKALGLDPEPIEREVRAALADSRTRMSTGGRTAGP
ncbi:hypothetical protein ACIO6U_18365 [Streptomyces sp. NPDC087422]|uniref:hypothetical protein n=1 Tax=Streptomyces sp. NPDC087422 TaxID=3365786 RepID=UPI00382658BC